MQNNSKTFCILPWIHAATLTDGTTQLCCLSEPSPHNLNTTSLDDYWNSDYLKNVRLKKLKGEKVQECNRCYREEEFGYRSHRVVENKLWEERLKENFQERIDSTNSDGGIPDCPITIDLRLSNTCNLQCIMCQPRESSRWLKLAEHLAETLDDEELKAEWKYKRNIQVDLFDWYKKEEFWETMRFMIPDIQEIILGGGEPLLIDHHVSFLEECVREDAAKNIYIRYHTNATVFNKKLTNIWKEFKTVELCVSLDGIEELAEYVRFPSKWNQIENNIKQFDQLPDNVILKFNYSVHALNIHGIIDFIDWVENQNFNKRNQISNKFQIFAHPSCVNHPEYLHVSNLPETLKKEITEKFQNKIKNYPDNYFEKYDSIFSIMNSQPAKHFEKLKKYINALDQLRNTKIENVFKELKDYL
jgi:molybdenum cofactor biosynthesis enzyme MoaA